MSRGSKEPTIPPSPTSRSAGSRNESQFVLKFETRETQDKSSFVVGYSNRTAVEWIDRWPAWPVSGFVLWGPPASGKSHLVAVWLERSGGTSLPADALGDADPPGLAVAVEDVISGAGEQELFHFLNRMKEKGGSTLVTCRDAPASMGFGLRDLASRLRAMPSARLSDPDDEILEQVLQKLFADRGVRVGEGVPKFLVRRMERSYAAAQSLVCDLNAAALARGKKMTVPFVQAWIRETGRTS